MMKEIWKDKISMLNKDDIYFYELLCKQVIHKKRKNAVAKMPERIYDNFDKKKKLPENIEDKYEKELFRVNEENLMEEAFRSDE